MQQTVQPYYTISASVLLWNAGSSLLSTNKDIGFNILLDIQPARVPELLSLLNTVGREFLFSLPASTAKNAVALKALLPACYLLTSMHLYAAGDAPFVPVIAEQSGEPLQTGLLQNYFAEQGITALTIPISIIRNQACKIRNPVVSLFMTQPRPLMFSNQSICCLLSLRLTMHRLS